MENDNIQNQEAEGLLMASEFPVDADFALELKYADPDKQEDHDWQERTNLDESSLCGAIETIIFMSDRPVTIQKLRDLIDPLMPLRVIHQSINRLQSEYEASHHGIRLQEVAEGFQFRTKSLFTKYVQDLFKVNSLVLSPTALEVLAIIAYKQPVSRMEIERIRGVESSHIVRALMDKRLVSANGRSDEMGRPVLYGTTLEFLEVFNLKSIEDLPPEYELEAMLDKNKMGEISDIRSIVAGGDKDRFKFDEIDELDQLQETIKGIDADTFFTKVLKEEDQKRKQGDASAPAKSAFDLLEEFIRLSEVKNQNQVSSSSELLTSIADPTVIPDLGKGPFNLPMIDDEMLADSNDDSNDDNAENFDQLFADTPELTEAEKLGLSLDQAYQKLSLLNEDQESHFNAENEDELQRLEAQIDENLQSTQNKAQELGISLDFLQDHSDEAPDTGKNEV